MLLVALAMFGVFFFVSLYLQNVLGYSPVETGAAFLPMTLMIILLAPVAGRTSDRIGSRVPMTAGMILVGIHLLLFSRLGANTDFWDLMPALALGGIGMALTMTPSAAAATRAVPVDKAGVGAAVLNAFRQVGGSLGIATMGAIMAARIGDPPTTTGFLDGFQRALEVAAVIAFVGAIVAFVLVRPHGSSASRRSPDPDPARA
jgi:MFS family permease